MSVQAPRLRVVLDGGQDIPGAISAEVTQTGHYHADTFSASFATGARGAPPLDWWGSQGTILLSVQVALLAGPDAAPAWTTLVTGEVDHVHADPVKGTVAVEGRDLSSRLIEAKTREAFKNQTASEIATTLAQRHGLTPVVTATTTLADRYYQQDHDKLAMGQFSRATTEWDLLTGLAQAEGFDVFVQGTDLHFQPRTAPDAAPFVIRHAPGAAFPLSNVIDLRLERALTLAKDIEVDVRSWSSRQGRGFTKVVKAIGAKSASAATAANQNGTATQRYVVVRPNLTEDQALQLGQSILVDLSRNERVISFRVPGDIALTPRTPLRLQGTGSSWDQAYFPESIHRSVSFARGLDVSVRAKNHSPDSQVVLG